MKINIYRVQDYCQVEANNIGDALMKAEAGDVRFYHSPDRFIAIAQDKVGDVTSDKHTLGDAPALTDGEDEDGEA